VELLNLKIKMAEVQCERANRISMKLLKSLNPICCIKHLYEFREAAFGSKRLDYFVEAIISEAARELNCLVVKIVIKNLDSKFIVKILLDIILHI